MDELLIDLATNLLTDLFDSGNRDIVVGNLELEDGHDFLLEAGGFILWE